MTADESPKAQAAAKPGSPDLRLLDRRAFVGFPPLQVQPGLAITEFALQIPDVTFPFNLSGGAARYQKRKLSFGLLEVSLDAELVRRQVAEIAQKLPDLQNLQVQLRAGYLEGQAHLRNPEQTPVTFKVTFDGDGERLTVFVYDVRLYGFSPTPSCQIPVLLARSVQELELLPEAELVGAAGFSTRILPSLCQLASVSRGFKLPRLDGARLSTVDVSAQGIRLRFSSGGLPPPSAPDEEMLLTLEGARAFREPEALLAAGKLAAAREAYLKAAQPQEGHPFAAERLLSLLVADPNAHDLALDVAAGLLRRRENSPVGLWAEAVVRERRGEHARAAERYLALCARSRQANEETSAFFAAEAAARAAREQAPNVAVRALHEVLGLRPDHLPSLKALARASDQAKDKAGAIRAYRRITALARDPAEAALAHVRLAQLSALTDDDVAGARLHCEAALKLAPDHPEALAQLGELCYRAGEHLRALKALDRLRDVALARHELDRVGRSHLLAGKVWETGLSQLDNALLRYKEATALLPGDPEPLFHAARVADALGRTQEAVDGYLQTVELAGPAPASEEVRAAAHASRRALARLYRTKLGDPAKAREQLEAALALDPKDMEAMEELLPSWRAAGRAPELAAALERAAERVEEPARRAGYLAEAGELQRSRLGDPARAEKLLLQALESQPSHRAALESLLAVAEGRRDGPLLCRALKALGDLTSDPADRVRYWRRLVVAARDVTFDLELTASALSELLKAEPDDLPALAELCAVQRKRADMDGLARALEQRARVAEVQRDVRLASASLRELSQVLEARLGRPGEALVALEKAVRLAPDPAVLMELADLSLRCDRPENARRALDEVLSLLPRQAPPEKLAEVRAKLGRACELLGDREAAIAHYAEALPFRRLDDELAGRLEALYQDAQKTPELAELWTSRAQALMAADRGEAAAPLLLKSARLLVAQGKSEAALHQLNSALELAPQGPHVGEILETLAELELAAGDKVAAAKLLGRRAAMLPDPKAAARVFLKAATLSAGTRREEAYLADALAQDSTHPGARLRRGELLLESQPGRALEDFEVALRSPEVGPEALPPTERSRVHRLAATAAAQAARPEVARHHLEEYVRRRPEDLEALRQLAQMLRETHSEESLVQLLSQLAPKLTGTQATTAYRELAELSLKFARTPEATQALRELVRRDENDRWAASALLNLLPPTEAEEAVRLLSILVKSAAEGERANFLVRRAQLQKQLGQRAQAQADLLAAAALVDDGAPLFIEAAQLAHELGDQPAELAAWTAALKADPAHWGRAADRVLTLARLRLEQKDYAPVRDALRLAVSLPLSEAQLNESLFALARASLALGEPDVALFALERAAQAGPAPRRIDAWMWRAQLAEKNHLRKMAIASLEAVLALSPRHAEALKELKRLLAEAQDWSGLAQLLSAQAAEAPRADAAALFAELGGIYADKLEETGPAEAAFRRSISLEPGNAEVRLQLFKLLLDKQAWTEAAEVAEAAAQGLPSDRGALLLRQGATLALQSGDPKVALRLLRQAHALAPATGKALWDFAEALYAHGAREEALPLYQSICQDLELKDAPDRAEGLLLAYADLAENAGQPEAAERAYWKILRDRPQSHTAAERLAALLAKKSPRAAVEFLLQFASSVAPSDALGQLLVRYAVRAKEQLADVELASRVLVQAASMVQEPLKVHQRLAAMLREAGRTQELVAALRTVASLCLKSEDLASAISAYEEQVAIAETAGRVDEALQTLTTMREACEKSGQLVLASEYERRRAELLRDAKGDLEGAAQALDRAYLFYPDVALTQLGSALARRRKDEDAEALWAGREVELASGTQAVARARLELAKLHLRRKASKDAEKVLKELLRDVPGHEEASQLFLQLLEKQGRAGEVAAHYEELAQRTAAPDDKVRLFRQAAAIFRDRLRRPDAAASALLAARAVRPDDLELTAEAAELLHQAKREADAAEFDAILLQKDPFRSPSYERQRAWLESTKDQASLASLMLARAERQSGPQAAQSYLEAAAAFRATGAKEQAALCEQQAFEQAPQDAQAFSILRSRAEGDVRRTADLLAMRARAVGTEAPALLKERAQKLTGAGEALLAAQAWDELLALTPEDPEALLARAELAAAAGGARAAQPYDRRLLQAGGPNLPRATLLRLQLRLGNAALMAGAYQDAVDSLEAVLQLDPASAQGQQALSLLAEAHTKTGDAQGLYRTSLELARRSPPDESEALYRRAAALFPDPKQAIDALMPLAALRPSDPEVVDRAVRGLKSLGRMDEVLKLLEKSAEAVGGPKAAELLAQAAQVASQELHDEPRALALTERATKVDPSNLAVLKALADAYRSRKASMALRGALTQLVAVSPPGDEPNLWRLELAQLALADGEPGQARAALETIVDQGPGSAGYAQALELLEPLLNAGKDAALLGNVLAARAEMQQGHARAELLLKSAEAFMHAQDPAKASRFARAAVTAEPSMDGYLLLADILGAQGEGLKRAQSLQQAAQLAPEDAQQTILRDAAQAFEAAGHTAESREILDRIANASLARGALDEALAYAEKAQDRPRIRQVLWKMVESGHEGSLERLAADLTGQEAPVEELLRAAGFARTARAAGPLQALLGGAVERIDERAAPETLQGLVEQLQELPADPGDGLWRALPGRLPTRGSALAREQLARLKAQGELSRAAALLPEIIKATAQAPARAALRSEEAGLLLQLGDAARAKASLDQALQEDPSCASALRQLMGLCRSQDPGQFVALAERLAGVEGAGALAGEQLALAEAYEKLGRTQDAYRILAEVEQTPALVQRRAGLALALGLGGEALQLKEKVAQTPAELEEIAKGYLQANLVPFAARLGQKLFEAHQLSPESQRLFAEQLAPAPQGAPLAALLWPGLLEQNLADPDGWTLFSEALRALNHPAAALADGVGAALTASTTQSAVGSLKPVARGQLLAGAPAPAGSVRVDPASMPRLELALRTSLTGLGAENVHVRLDPNGGCEAYLIGANELVLGAGALGHFASVELGYLLALALALGDRGRSLTGFSAIEGLEAAAVAAFDSVPSTLAAGRVLALLDDRVRGAERDWAGASVLLRDNAAFQAVCRRVLQRAR